MLSEVAVERLQLLLAVTKLGDHFRRQGTVEPAVPNLDEVHQRAEVFARGRLRKPMLAWKCFTISR